MAVWAGRPEGTKTRDGPDVPIGGNSPGKAERILREIREG